MQMSFASEELRKYCQSLLEKNLHSSPFTTVEEVIHARALLADLKAAPNLFEAPVNYLVNKDNNIIFVTIVHGNIEINCHAITLSLNKPPDPKQIKRLKIIEILTPNLQTKNFKDLSA